MKSSLQKEIDEWLGQEDSTIPEPTSPALQSSFFDMVDNMIKLNRQHRMNLPMNVPTSISPVQFAMEFCTVKCDIGRRTGKTGYVKYKADENSFIIVPEHQLVRSYPKNLIVKCVRDIIHFPNIFHGKKAQTIYIDEPQMVFRSIPQPDLYYRLVDEMYDQTFILLGA
jgi:hypothetical protein